MINSTLKFIFTVTLFVLCCPNTTAQQQTVGVNIYDQDATSDGYIFFSPRYYTDAYLIDNCGRLINSWKRSNYPGLSGYLTKTGLMLRTNKVTFPQFGQASTGGNIELVDWDNTTLWSSDFNTPEYIQHHDAVLMPNGNIIFIGWERISKEEQLDYGRKPSALSDPELWGEFIWEIKPIGSSSYEVVWEWHLKDHFVQDYNSSLDNYGVVKDEIGKVDINYYGPGAWDDDDWWHCNALDYNAELDQILVNSRNINELWIIDHSTTTQEAKGSTGGNSGKGGELLFRWGNPQAYDRGNGSNLRMYGSHGHYWIPKGYPNEGKIMYFNNGDDRPQGYYSTVEMIDPVISNGSYQTNSNQHYYPIEPEVAYIAPNPNDFVSTYLSNAKQLKNGNIFINEGGPGRLFEVDENKNIVWQYINPVDFTGVNSQGEFPSANSNFRAYKYAPDYEGLENADLTPGNLLEGDSEFNICKSLSTESLEQTKNVDISHDLHSNTLSIQNPHSFDLNVQILTIGGQKIAEHHTRELQSQFDLSDLSQGIYVVIAISQQNNQIVKRKIVKF